MAVGGSLQTQAKDEEVTYYDDYPNASPAPAVFPSLPGMVPSPYGSFSMQAIEANGGWIASPVDMLRFTAGIDTHAGAPLISASSLAQMLADPSVPGCNTDGSTAPASSAQWYGFGVSVYANGNLAHSGALAGSTTEDVIGSNGFSFAAFFNSRPASAYQIATDLDQTLWKAFSAVGTWSSEDYFDQFASFSDWLAPSAFASQSLTAQASGEYPARVEGRLSGGVLEYRGEFVPLHTLTLVESRMGLDCVSYRAL